MSEALRMGCIRLHYELSTLSLCSGCLNWGDHVRTAKMAEDLIRRSIKYGMYLRSNRLAGVRTCGISAVSWQASCFLSLQLDMQRGATGSGRRRHRDDRNAGALSCNGGSARLSGVRPVASRKVLIGSIHHDSERLVSNLFLLCLGAPLRETFRSLYGPGF